MTRDAFTAFLEARSSDALDWISRWLAGRPKQKRDAWLAGLMEKMGE